MLAEGSYGFAAYSGAGVSTTISATAIGSGVFVGCKVGEGIIVGEGVYVGFAICASANGFACVGVGAMFIKPMTGDEVAVHAAIPTTAQINKMIDAGYNRVFRGGTADLLMGQSLGLVSAQRSHF